MKIFLKYFAMPLLIAVIASVLYIIDSLIAGLFVQGASFMWVGFAAWTVFYTASLKDRIKGLLGLVIGFASAVIMMLITSSFNINILSISLSCLLGVFLINGAVMFMNHLEKIWLNSVTGVFIGIFLTFSGFGVGLTPVSSVNNAFLMLTILLIYGILGMGCGYVSNIIQKVINKHLTQYEKLNKVCDKNINNLKVRMATIEELENWWDSKIEKQPNNPAYKKWKQNFVEGNKIGERKTFFVFNDNNEYVGQGTLLLKNDDPLMTGEGKAEIIKLEINPEYRGKRIATLIYNTIEEYAKSINITTLTIGVEPCEVKNIQIYFHWGFTNYLQCITETFPPREEGGEGEVITVLCYSKDIK